MKHKFLFKKNNYIILIISLLILTIGFMLMTGGGSEDGVSFNPEIFSARRITIAPIVVVMGYVGVVIAIFWND